MAANLMDLIIVLGEKVAEAGRKLDTGTVTVALLTNDLQGSAGHWH